MGLQIRDRNHGRGVDVAIDVSGSDRGLQGALSAAGLSATVVAAGYQGVRRTIAARRGVPPQPAVAVASIGGWGRRTGTPQWNRRRVLDVATQLLYTDRVSVEGLLTRTFPFDHALEAYAWLDEHPQEAVKVALDYGGSQ